MNIRSHRHGPSVVPARAGVALKPAHYQTILAAEPDVGFFEVHAENYMGAGGPPHRYLEAVRARYPLSLHGVGLSIGADQPLNVEHLARLKMLIERYRPGLFSEHLAWSTHDGSYFNDLLPLPYTTETLARVSEHINAVQGSLGKQMLLENPSTYITFTESAYTETDFIAEIVQRTGCGLLLDLNNVYVASINQQRDPLQYIASYPLAHVKEIHLAGHATEVDDENRPLLIDTHDRAVDDLVWDLFARVVAITGPVPTLIEWDAAVPSWPVLLAEVERADALMIAARDEEERSAAVG